MADQNNFEYKIHVSIDQKNIHGDVKRILSNFQHEISNNVCKITLTGNTDDLVNQLLNLKNQIPDLDISDKIIGFDFAENLRSDSEESKKILSNLVTYMVNTVNKASSEISNIQQQMVNVSKEIDRVNNKKLRLGIDEKNNLDPTKALANAEKKLSSYKLEKQNTNRIKEAYQEVYNIANSTGQQVSERTKQLVENVKNQLNLDLSKTTVTKTYAQMVDEVELENLRLKNQYLELEKDLQKAITPELEVKGRLANNFIEDLQSQLDSLTELEVKVKPIVGKETKLEVKTDASDSIKAEGESAKESKEPKRFEKAPEGWTKVKHATTAPKGWEWYSNGKPLLDGYDSGLVRIAKDHEEAADAAKKQADAEEKVNKVEKELPKEDKKPVVDTKNNIQELKEFFEEYVALGVAASEDLENNYKRLLTMVKNGTKSLEDAKNKIANDHGGYPNEVKHTQDINSIYQIKSLDEVNNRLEIAQKKQLEMAESAESVLDSIRKWTGNKHHLNRNMYDLKSDSRDANTPIYNAVDYRKAIIEALKQGAKDQAAVLYNSFKLNFPRSKYTLDSFNDDDFKSNYDNYLKSGQAKLRSMQNDSNLVEYRNNEDIIHTLRIQQGGLEREIEKENRELERQKKILFEIDKYRDKSISNLDAEIETETKKYEEAIRIRDEFQERITSVTGKSDDEIKRKENEIFKQYGFSEGSNKVLSIRSLSENIGVIEDRIDVLKSAKQAISELQESATAAPPDTSGEDKIQEELKETGEQAKETAEAIKKVNDSFASNEKFNDNIDEIKQINEQLDIEHNKLKEIEKQQDINNHKINTINQAKENYHEYAGLDKTKALYDIGKLSAASKALKDFNTQLENRNEFQDKYNELVGIIENNYLGKYGIENEIYDSLDSFMSSNSSLKYLQLLSQNGIKGESSKKISNAFEDAVKYLKSEGRDVSKLISSGDVYGDDINSSLADEERELEQERTRLSEEREEHAKNIYQLQQKLLESSINQRDVDKEINDSQQKELNEVKTKTAKEFKKILDDDGWMFTSLPTAELDNQFQEHFNIIQEQFMKGLIPDNEVIDKLNNEYDRLLESVNNPSTQSSIVSNQNEIQTEFHETAEKAKEATEAINEEKQAEGQLIIGYRAYNRTAGVVGDKGMTWFSDDIDTMKTYIAQNPSRNVIKKEIDTSKLFKMDAQGAEAGVITYLGDQSDETSKKITEVYDKIQILKKELAEKPSDELSKELENLEREYRDLSDDKSNMYGTHSTEWFADRIKERGYKGVEFNNVIDDYYMKSGKTTTTIVLFDNEALKNTEDITTQIKGNIEKTQEVFDRQSAINTHADYLLSIPGIDETCDDIDILKNGLEDLEDKERLVSMSTKDLSEYLREITVTITEDNGLESGDLYGMFNDEIVHLFDKDTAIGKYYDYLVQNTDFGKTEEEVSAAYEQIAQKILDFQKEVTDTMRKKLQFMINQVELQSDEEEIHEEFSEASKTVTADIEKETTARQNNAAAAEEEAVKVEQSNEAKKRSYAEFEKILKDNDAVYPILPTSELTSQFEEYFYKIQRQFVDGLVPDDKVLEMLDNKYSELLDSWTNRSKGKNKGSLEVTTTTSQLEKEAEQARKTAEEERKLGEVRKDAVAESAFNSFHEKVLDYRFSDDISPWIPMDGDKADPKAYNAVRSELNSMADTVLKLQNEYENFDTNRPIRELEKLEDELRDAEVRFAGTYSAANQYWNEGLDRPANKGGASKKVQDLYGYIMSGSGYFNNEAWERNSKLLENKAQDVSDHIQQIFMSLGTDQISSQNLFNWIEENGTIAEKEILRINYGLEEFRKVLRGLATFSGGQFDFAETFGLDTVTLNQNSLSSDTTAPLSESRPIISQLEKEAEVKRDDTAATNELIEAEKKLREETSKPIPNIIDAEFREIPPVTPPATPLLLEKKNDYTRDAFYRDIGGTDRDRYNKGIISSNVSDAMSKANSEAATRNWVEGLEEVKTQATETGKAIKNMWNVNDADKSVDFWASELHKAEEEAVAAETAAEKARSKQAIFDNGIDKRRSDIDNVKINTKEDVEYSEELQERINEVNKELVALKKNLDNITTPDQLKEWSSKFDALKSKVKGVNQDIAEENKSNQNSSKNSLKEDKSKYVELLKEENALKLQLKTIDSQEDASNINEKIDAIQKEKEAIEEIIKAKGEETFVTEKQREADEAYAQSEKKLADDAEALEKKRLNLLQQITQWLKSNPIAERKYGSLLSEGIETLNSSARVTPEILKQIETEFKKVKLEATKAGDTGAGFFQILKQRWQSLGAYLGSFASFYRVAAYVRQAITSIRELDDALTEMRKVSDESVSTLKAFQKESFNIADQVGSTAKVIQDSTADWMRLGESLNEAKESAKDASILLNVSEFQSIDEATTALVAMSQAYKDMDKIDIIDKLNNIGNNFSISTDQLATGLQNAAAVLKTQGNDIDKSIALLTAANSIVQDISKASTGMRTIALRIAGTETAKKELEELGESVDDYIVQTQSKTQETIKAYTAVASNAGRGIDVLDTNGNLRDTYDILLDISKIYKEIQEEDKKAGTNRAKALVEYIAGKNRSNIAASVLENPELLEEVYKASQDSAGSALEENEKYLDSISGHIAKLQNQLQKLYTDTIDSGFVKWTLDLLTNVTKLVDKVGLLRSAIIGIATVIGSKKLGYCNQVGSDIHPCRS